MWSYDVFFFLLALVSVVLIQSSEKQQPMENEFSLVYSSKAAGEPKKPASRDTVPSEEIHFFQFLRPSKTVQMFKHLSLWETFPIQTTPGPNLKPVRFCLKIPTKTLFQIKSHSKALVQ